MPTRETLEQVLDRLPEESVREVLDFASFVALQREREAWHSAARTRFAEAYGPDEPEPTNGQASQACLNQVQAMQAALIQRQGVLPDSAAEIAADRMR